MTFWEKARKHAAHGVAGGALTSAQGGSFKSGFASAWFSAAASNYLEVRFPEIDDLSRTAAAALTGGTASVLAGGKFANGAVTAAFRELFNELAGAHEDKLRDDREITGARIRAVPAFSDPESIDAAAEVGRKLAVVLGQIGTYVKQHMKQVGAGAIIAERITLRDMITTVIDGVVDQANVGEMFKVCPTRGHCCGRESEGYTSLQRSNLPRSPILLVL